MDTIWIFTIVIASIIPFSILLILMMNLSERITYKIKNKLLSSKMIIRKVEYMHGNDYIKEIIRSDGYVTYRDNITKEEYIQHLRELKLKKIIG